MPTGIVANDPIWILLGQFREFVTSKWRKPHARLHALRSDRVGENPHAALLDKLARLERSPVAPCSHVAIIDEAHVKSDGTLGFFQYMGIL
eukprot:CAMPEP_0196147458 /NCGR_PEP_ID=MMETSP0910-20130528/25459_1 /TAXON_ID=49265 /ORGANISM="Thalassiosira rotula, Strain GSO102" /LENGTH=90 /DNA_ID=CAMNT_0041409883 /DNA_START=30 /DNA_END=298 /DNA_ORIENTATION=-